MLPISAGESRTWTNPDGTKQFVAEFISRENKSITLLRSDRKRLTVDMGLLHEDDRRWLDANHPPTGAEKAGDVPAASAVFDTLEFGDDRNTVTEKLKSSKMVEANLDSTFLGRTGLNGIYCTVHKIGGLHCYLFFDWEKGGGLKEITLQTENKQAGEYDSVLKPCWEELVDLISPIHGKPLQTTKFPAISSLGDGAMLASHLWRIEHGGTVLLGTSRQGNGYQVVVRFTRERIEVKRVP